MSNKFVTEKDFGSSRYFSTRPVKYNLESSGRKSIEDVEFNLTLQDFPSSSSDGLNPIEAKIQIRIIFESIQPGDYAILYGGNLTLLIDGLKTIDLSGAADSNIRAHDREMERYKKYIDELTADTAPYIKRESLEYDIDRTILETLCTASSIKVHLTGAYHNAEWSFDGNELIFMAKALWNNAIDKTIYADDLKRAVQKKTGKKVGCLLQIISFLIGFSIAFPIEEINASTVTGLALMIAPLLIGKWAKLRKRQ